MTERVVYMLAHPSATRVAAIVLLPELRVRIDELDYAAGRAVGKWEIEPTSAGGEIDTLSALVGLGYLEAVDVEEAQLAWMAGIHPADLPAEQQRIVWLVMALHRAVDTAASRA